jgi:hypothetical protein
MPQKLTLQLATAEASRFASPIVATRFLARYVGQEHVWPRRLPRTGEPLSEYILCQSGPLFGEGVLLPSTLLCRRELMREVPFDLQLWRLQDVDWLIHIGARADVGVEFVASREPLVVWNQLEFAPTKTTRRSAATWRDYLDWLNRMRPLLTRRAYSSALLTWLAPSSVRLKEKAAFWPYLRAALQYGAPRPVDVASYLAFWFIPVGVRSTLSRWYGGLRRATPR